MLKTAKRAQIQKLAKEKGKTVDSVSLCELPAFSLVRITSNTNQIYVIETLDFKECAGLKVLIARPQVDLVMDSNIKKGAVRIGFPLIYQHKGKDITTAPINDIQLLSS